MQIKIINQKISLIELTKIAKTGFGEFVKAVVDINKNIMAINGELHADEEAVLLDQGSNQEDLWGINLYPEKIGSRDWIEFDSMINIRPSQNNRSREVEDKQTREKIRETVNNLIE